MALKATRKVILRGADGIVFVLDSQKNRLQENQNSLKDIENIVKSYGQSFEKLPMVFQYNKRDLPEANLMSITELRTALNFWNKPDFPAVAIKEEGVFETLKSISKSVVAVLKGGDLV